MSLTRRDSRKGELFWLKFEGIQSVAAGKAWRQYTAPWQWKYEAACSHLRSGSRERRTLVLSLLLPFYLQSSSPDCTKQEGRGQAEPGDGDCPSVWHDLSFEGCVGALQERCYSEYCGLSAFPATARMWCSDRQWSRGRGCQNLQLSDLPQPAHLPVFPWPCFPDEEVETQQGAAGQGGSQSNVR